MKPSTSRDLPIHSIASFSGGHDPHGIEAKPLDLNSVEAVGKDLDFLSPVTGPTIKVAEMTVAGVGDLLAVFVSLPDWRLAHFVGMAEEYTSLPQELLGPLDEILLACADKIRRRTTDGMDVLAMEAAARRAAMLEEAVRRYRNVSVTTFDGLLVDYAEKIGASVIVRGIRAVSDYEYELQMAMMNRRLSSKVETVFMIPAEAYSYLSSRLVKEIPVDYVGVRHPRRLGWWGYGLDFQGRYRALSDIGIIRIKGTG
jgi:pantetheine-phosphate adenylyltransferase